MKLKRLLLLKFALWGSIGSLWAQATARPDTSLLRCVAISQKTTYKYREPITINVQLINRSKYSLQLIDGRVNSEIWLYFSAPKLEVYRLSKNGPAEKVIRASEPGDLSFGVQLQNLVVLQPNQPYPLLYSQEPLGWESIPALAVRHEPLRPGSYVVQFVYSTIPVNSGNIGKLIYELAGAREKTQEAIYEVIKQIKVVRTISAPIYLNITR